MMSDKLLEAMSLLVESAQPFDKATMLLREVRDDQADEITRLQTKVDELEKERDFYSEKNRACHKISLGLVRERDTLKEKLEAAYESIREHAAIGRSLQESEAALKVMIERLQGIMGSDQFVEYKEEDVISLLHTTPAQSLTTHNQKIERETIERCAAHADNHTVHTEVTIGGSIRNLPSAYGEEGSRFSGDRSHSEEIEGCKRYYKEENPEEH